MPSTVNCLSPQGAQDDDPTVLVVPGGHGLHRVKSLRSLKVPAGQRGHTEAPGLLKVPSRHALHTLLLADGLNVPAVQGAHCVEPHSEVLDPGAHGEHWTPSGDALPGRQSSHMPVLLENS